MKYVIKHMDRNEYVRCHSRLSFWNEDINEATQFDTLEDAQIEIVQRGIPYATAVLNSASRCGVLTLRGKPIATSMMQPK